MYFKVWSHILSSLSPKWYQAKIEEETFLEIEEAEILLEEYLVIWWVWSLPLEWIHLPALELALESKLDKSEDLSTH